MTSVVAQAVLAEIEAQYARNMEWLKLASPMLVQELENPSSYSISINVDDSGQISVRITSPEGGMAEYTQQELWQAASERLRELASPQRPVWTLMSGPELAGFLDEGRVKEFLNEDILIRDYGEAYFCGVYQRLFETYRTVRGDVPYVLRPQFGKDLIPIMVVVGAVEGWLIEQLVEQWNVRHLILVDTYPAGMKLSLCFTDFPALAQRFTREGRRLSLLMDPQPQKLARKIMDEVQAFWPPQFCHGLVSFAGIHLKQDLVELGSYFDQCVRSVNEGWGFIEDELASLRHTHFNLKQGVPVCHEVRRLPPGCTAIICGAGPSLDEAIEFIKRNRENAMVFSCSSALRKLYNAGIVPDFHMELERTSLTLDVLRSQVPSECLKQLRIISPALMYPEVASHCGELLLIAKLKDAGSRALLNNFPQFPAVGPTVTNCALNLCVEFGFSEIVLCGVDYGWLEGGSQHAGDTIYDDSAELILAKSGQTLKVEDSYQGWVGLTVKGNFRDTVRTDPVLDNARLTAEGLIALSRGVRVINTADGARIEGAAPCRANELKLEPGKLTNQHIVDWMKSGFKPVPSAMIEQREHVPSQSLNALIRNIRARIPAKLESRKAWLGCLVDLRLDLPPGDPELFTGWVLISGSLSMFLFYLQIAVCSLEDEAAAAVVAEQGRVLLLEMLDIAEKIGENWQQWPATHHPVS